MVPVETYLTISDECVGRKPSGFRQVSHWPLKGNRQRCAVPYERYNTEVLEELPSAGGWSRSLSWMEAVSSGGGGHLNYSGRANEPGVSYLSY